MKAVFFNQDESMTEYDYHAPSIIIECYQYLLIKSVKIYQPSFTILVLHHPRRRGSGAGCAPRCCNSVPRQKIDVAVLVLMGDPFLHHHQFTHSWRFPIGGINDLPLISTVVMVNLDAEPRGRRWKERERDLSMLLQCCCCC